MFSLRHFIEIFADPSIVRMAISSTDGIQGWWAKYAKSDAQEVGRVKVNFGKHYKNLFEIEKQSSEDICWLVVEGNKEWIGTRIRF